jgi:hypothetical protein
MPSPSVADLIVQIQSNHNKILLGIIEANRLYDAIDNSYADCTSYQSRKIESAIHHAHQTLRSFDELIKKTEKNIPTVLEFLASYTTYSTEKCLAILDSALGLASMLNLHTQDIQTIIDYFNAISNHINKQTPDEAIHFGYIAISDASKSKPASYTKIYNAYKAQCSELDQMITSLTSSIFMLGLYRDKLFISLQSAVNVKIERYQELIVQYNTEIKTIKALERKIAGGESDLLESITEAHQRIGKKIAAATETQNQLKQDLAEAQQAVQTAAEAAAQPAAATRAQKPAPGEFADMEFSHDPDIPTAAASRVEDKVKHDTKTKQDDTNDAESLSETVNTLFEACSCLIVSIQVLHTKNTDHASSQDLELRQQCIELMTSQLAEHEDTLEAIDEEPDIDHSDKLKTLHPLLEDLHQQLDQAYEKIITGTRHSHQPQPADVTKTDATTQTDDLPQPAQKTTKKKKKRRRKRGGGAGKPQLSYAELQAQITEVTQELAEHKAKYGLEMVPYQAPKPDNADLIRSMQAEILHLHTIMHQQQLDKQLHLATERMVWSIRANHIPLPIPSRLSINFAVLPNIFIHLWQQSITLTHHLRPLPAAGQPMHDHFFKLFLEMSTLLVARGANYYDREQQKQQIPVLIQHITQQSRAHLKQDIPFLIYGCGLIDPSARSACMHYFIGNFLATLQIKNQPITSRVDTAHLWKAPPGQPAAHASPLSQPQEHTEIPQIVNQ